MSEPISPSAGDLISPFEADSTAGRFSLADLKQTLVLYFYPKDNTPGCTTQSVDFRDQHEAFFKCWCDGCGYFTRLIEVSRKLQEKV